MQMDTSKLKRQKALLSSELKLFNRILLRDSTTQQLPAPMYEHFKGIHVKGEPIGITRIQALFNFTEEKWEYFSIDSYAKNDQKAAPEIADVLQPGDLLLQDLGYFTLDWLEELTEKQFIITKWDNRTKLLNTDGEALCLLELLKGRKMIDTTVLVGGSKQLPMRMVVKKLPKKEAEKRIAKARKDKHRDTNHSEEYYELLRYEIYLTNIEQQTLKAKQIAKLYGLRWHIEILFKSWKSYANFKRIFSKEKMQVHRVKFTIYAMLILFVYMMNIYHFVKRRIKQITQQHLSILKFMDVINDFFKNILRIKVLEDLIRLIPQFAKHAVYRQHSKRKNTIEKYLYVKELCVT